MDLLKRAVDRMIREAAPGGTGTVEAGAGTLGPSLVRQLPAWVRRFALVAVPPADYCLCCEPSPDPAEVFPSQFVLAAPPGRYQVETYDLATSACLSLESAEGGPLVGGLACTGHPVLVVVRALDGPNLGVS